MIGSHGQLLVGICESPMQEQLGSRPLHSIHEDSPEDYMMNGNNSSYGENEASMMMMMHPSPSTDEFPLPDGHDDFRRDDVKLPTAVKRKESNVMKIYARKFGLNDRGCYVAVVLGGLAFFFLLIILAMAAAWPGRSQLMLSSSVLGFAEA